VKARRVQIAAAFFFTSTVLVVGYSLLGLLPAFLFAFGFVGGFVLWLAIPRTPMFSTFRKPYYLTLALFVLHKAEERHFEFFPALARITGKPVPQPDSFLAVMLYALAGAWLLVPYLVKKEASFGYYLAWTFFTSMGVIELAHFAFPFFTPERYGYFPGMASVVLLAPAAWWGMRNLVRRAESSDIVSA